LPVVPAFGRIAVTVESLISSNHSCDEPSSRLPSLMERRRCNATGLSFTRSLRIRAAIEPSRAEDKLVVFLVFTSIDLETIYKDYLSRYPIPDHPKHASTQDRHERLEAKPFARSKRSNGDQHKPRLTIDWTAILRCIADPANNPQSIYC